MNTDKAVDSQKPEVYMNVFNFEDEDIKDMTESDLNIMMDKIKDKLITKSSENLDLSNMKIKIVKIDSNSKDIEKDDFNSIISSILTDNPDRKKVERMNANYNFLHDEQREFDYITKQDHDFNKEKDEIIDKNYIFQHVSVKDFLDKRKKKDESDNLIVF